jgi:hypothetical protein
MHNHYAGLDGRTLFASAGQEIADQTEPQAGEDSSQSDDDFLSLIIHGSFNRTHHVAPL